MPAIKYDDTPQRLAIISYYESKGYHTEFQHDIGATGVIYANTGHDTLHISSVKYAELKGYPVQPFYSWLLAQLKTITKGQDND